MTQIQTPRRSLLTRLSGPGGRRVTAGLADQALVALTTAGTALLAPTLLSKPAAGTMLYAVLVIVFIQGLGRALVGDVMLTHVPRFAGDAARRDQFENAHATSAVLSVAAMVVLAVVWLVGPPASVGDLIWGIPFVPAILLQDLARYTYQTLRQQPQALVIDLCWVAVQTTGVLLVVWHGRPTGAQLLACWGGGAAAGAALFYVRTRLNPLHGRPAAWVRDTRALLGWFTATGIVAQLTTLLVGTLVQGLLTRTAFAGFRLVQTLVLQPAQSLVMVVNGLLVPRASVLAAAGDRAGLRRQTRSVLLVNALIGMVGVLLAAALAGPVLRWYRNGSYAAVAPIALPIALQAWVYLMQVPFTVAIRGMQRGRYLFLQYAVFGLTSLTGVVVGAAQAQLLGAAWGLLTGATVGLVVQVSLYLLAYQRLPGHPGAALGATPPRSTPPADAETLSTPGQS